MLFASLLVMLKKLKKKCLMSIPELGYRDNYRFHKILNRNLLCKADIVTNSGHLRPLDESFIGSLKDTAVNPTNGNLGR